MSNIKPSDHGIVVENKETGLRYASLDVNFDPKTERKVRELRAGESVFSYITKQGPEPEGSEELEGGSATQGGTSTPAAPANASSDGSEPSTGDAAGARKDSSATQTASTPSGAAGK